MLESTEATDVDDATDQHDGLTGEDAIRARLLGDVELDDPASGRSDANAYVVPDGAEAGALAAWRDAEAENVARAIAEREAREPGALPVNRGAYDPDAVVIGKASVVVNVETPKRRSSVDPYLGDTAENLMRQPEDGNPKTSSKTKGVPKPKPRLTGPERVERHARMDQPLSEHRYETEEERAARLIAENQRRLESATGPGRPLKGRERRMYVAGRIEPTLVSTILRTLGMSSCVAVLEEIGRMIEAAGPDADAETIVKRIADELASRIAATNLPRKDRP